MGQRRSMVSKVLLRTGADEVEEGVLHKIWDIVSDRTSHSTVHGQR